MYVTMEPFCNQCGKKFIFSMEEREFRQYHTSIEYLCKACEDERYGIAPTVNQAKEVYEFLKKVEHGMYFITGRNADGTFSAYPRSIVK